MLQIYHRRAFGPLGLLGVIATSLGLMGCPGNLDPSLLGGGTGTAGTSGGGGGSGGTASSNCTGALDGATIIGAQCAVSGCHNTVGAPIAGAGLDLTINATIASRLVGVTSPGDTTAGSDCSGFATPYLVLGSTPATGLLINKITTTAPNDALLCKMGSQMPYASLPLTSAQQQCVIQWATTLTTAAQ